MPPKKTKALAPKESPTQSARKPRFHFNPKKDVQLMQVVLQHSVWLDNNWNVVSESLKREQGYCISELAAKRRCLLLMQKYRQQELQSINKSGTEEEYSERAEVIKDVCEMWESEQQIVSVLGPDESGDKSEDETEENSSIIFEESEWSQVAGEASQTTTSSSNLPSSSNASGPSKRERAAEKKFADNERDKARDDALKVEIPQRFKSKRSLHLDAVEEKLRFDMEIKRRELESKEKEDERKYEILKKEIELKEEKQSQQFLLKKSELELEERRLELMKQTNDNNAIMLTLMKSVVGKQ